MAREQSREVTGESDLNCDSDVSALVAAVTDGQELAGEWPIYRLVSASAKAAAVIPHAVEAADFAEEVFNMRQHGTSASQGVVAPQSTIDEISETGQYQPPG